MEANNKVKNDDPEVESPTSVIKEEVKDGGYDHMTNKTVNIITQKTYEIRQRTRGIMKRVMTLASQKIEEFAKYYQNENFDNWQQNENNIHDFNQDNKGRDSSIREGQTSSGGQTNTYHSNSWDD
ncbi:hypothetical protein KIW84_064639 [Lathyrus oleraceus]|uniref:Uncharacterized protein n=1 Tax=Pisum sativum TaxID=3888 RepID=A0A9D5A8G4_PEA|nr:hypothetical protein KIW84_064639 [Pisum sativum]